RKTLCCQFPAVKSGSLSECLFQQYPLYCHLNGDISGHVVCEPLLRLRGKRKGRFFGSSGLSSHQTGYWSDGVYFTVICQGIMMKTITRSIYLSLISLFYAPAIFAADGWLPKISDADNIEDGS